MIELNYTTQPYTSDYELIPEGIYTAKITGAEERESRSGTKYISLRFEIMGTRYAHRLIFKNLNLYHPKEEVKKIAYKFLDGIGYALELSVIHTFGETFNRFMKILVKIKNDRNDIVRLYKMDDNPVFKPIPHDEPVPALFKEETPHKLDPTTPKAGDIAASDNDEDDVPF